MVVFVVGLLPSQLWILRNQPPIGLFPLCSISPANICIITRLGLNLPGAIG